MNIFNFVLFSLNFYKAKSIKIINHQFGRCLCMRDIRDNVVMTHDIRHHVSRLRDCAVSPAISGHPVTDRSQ